MDERPRGFWGWSWGVRRVARRCGFMAFGRFEVGEVEVDVDGLEDCGEVVAGGF